MVRRGEVRLGSGVEPVCIRGREFFVYSWYLHPLTHTGWAVLRRGSVRLEFGDDRSVSRVEIFLFLLDFLVSLTHTGHVVVRWGYPVEVRC